MCTCVLCVCEEEIRVRGVCVCVCVCVCARARARPRTHADGGKQRSTSPHRLLLKSCSLVLQVRVDGRRHALRVVDTAGQERFRSLRANFYRGTQVCLLAFALDDLASFYNLSMWREEFLYHSGVAPGTAFPFIVVGNKADVQQRVVSDLSAHEWCRANGDTPYFETSAKLALNVEEVFEAAVRRFHEVEFYNTLTASYEFLAWDEMSGEAGELVDLSATTGTRGKNGESSTCCS